MSQAAIERFLNDASPPPDEFLEWQEISIRGTHLIAKDAVIRHLVGEAVSNWAHVTVKPGRFVLSVKLFTDVHGANRIGTFRASALGSSPLRGHQLGEIGVDWATVGISDYDPYMAAVTANAKAYEWYADIDLFSLPQGPIGTGSFKDEPIYYVQSGCGDGIYPAYELVSDGAVVGIECDFHSNR